MHAAQDISLRAPVAFPVAAFADGEKSIEVWCRAALPGLPGLHGSRVCFRLLLPLGSLIFKTVLERVARMSLFSHFRMLALMSPSLSAKKLKFGGYPQLIYPTFTLIH